MVKINNNIKKWFIYIVGILFFIVALYVMLIPYNCKLNNKGFFESFADEIPANTTDSISVYMSMIGKNKKTIGEFDTYINKYKDIIQDGKPNGKLLIMSRCYQSPNTIVLNNDVINYNLFGSYTESIFIKNVTNFDSDVLDIIKTSIKDFHDDLNGICNKSKDKQKIQGTVYVIIGQYPLYQDDSTTKKTDIKISSVLLSQSKDINELKRYIYQPSYIAPISNYISNADANIDAKTNTPISYMVYIIYNSYKTGPKSNNRNTCIELQEKNSRFSQNYKDKNTNISTAEQCFISAMGSSGFSYIGGCASYQGILSSKNNNIPINKSFCSSPIQGDETPWTYTVLYTVNHPLVQFSVAQNDD